MIQVSLWWLDAMLMLYVVAFVWWWWKEGGRVGRGSGDASGRWRTGG